MGFIDGHKFDYCDVGDVKPSKNADNTDFHLKSAKEIIDKVFSRNPELKEQVEELTGVKYE